MKKTLKKLLWTTIVALETTTTVVMNSALAVDFTTTGTIIEYCSDGLNTFADGQSGMTCTESLETILNGNSAAPGGNVEIGGDEAENTSLTAFPAVEAATLTANLANNQTLTFSSLTYSDWFGSANPLDFSADNLATQWFQDSLATYGGTIRARAAAVNPLLNNDAAIFAALVSAGGFQRLSDPNVAYINQDSNSVTFGLAGHQNAGNLNPLLTDLWASEVVKVTKDGESEFFYSLSQPTDSGQVNKDGFSHQGNFEFRLAWSEEHRQGEKVSEPRLVLGLLALGLLAISKKLRI